MLLFFWCIRLASVLRCFFPFEWRKVYPADRFAIALSCKISNLILTFLAKINLSKEQISAVLNLRIPTSRDDILIRTKPPRSSCAVKKGCRGLNKATALAGFAKLNFFPALA